MHKAYLALMSPSNVAPLANPLPADTRAIPRGHLSIDQKMAIGRCLLHHKASLPHGHFGLWVEKQKGLSRSMAWQCMALAKGSEGEKRAA